MDANRVQGITDLMGDAGGEGNDGVDTLALHAVFGLDALLGDVTEHGHAAATLGALEVANPREMQGQQPRLGITDFELTREGADSLW